MALGWLGVLIQCGLAGYLLGLIYRKFVESDQSTFKVAAYMCFLPILVVAYRDGSVVTVFRQGIFYLAPVLLWLGIAKFFKVPLADDLRAAMAQLRRRAARGESTNAPPQSDEPAAPDQALRRLPPAVRRRRLALRQARAGGS
jgi:hypothetical protein